MIERILRNLVSNAVRYTDRGRILVACRRRGAAISVQVWDTGIGIPDDQQARVFQEYYQLGNPERDRAKGLGLGLAINGVDVIERLRSEYNESIHAILITGDTAPSRLAEAKESGLPMLHKPVSNSKLRAFIANSVASTEKADLADAETPSIK